MMLGGYTDFDIPHYFCKLVQITDFEIEEFITKSDKEIEKIHHDVEKYKRNNTY